MPKRTLRRAIEGYRRDEARARVGRWRGEASAESEQEVLSGYAWLARDEGLERLAEAEEEGSLGADEARAMRAQLADLHAERVLGQTRAAWRALPARVLERDGHRVPCGDLVEAVAAPDARANRSLRAAGVRALEQVAADVAPRIRDRQAQASAARAAVLGAAVPDAGSPVALAHAWLAASDDLAQEALARGASCEGLPHPERWEQLAALLSFTGLRGRFGERDRARRVGALFGALGLGRELSFVRIEPPHPSVGGRARLAVLDPTRDVRVSPSRRELGLASELALTEGVGRALGQLLAPAALPFVQRVPVVDHGPRALAALIMQVPFDPAAQQGGRALARERPHLAAAGVSLLALPMRVAAASVVARAEGTRDATVALAQRATGVPLPPALAQLLLAGEVAPPARFLAGLRSLVFWPRLRDAHDEDWFRNPRAAETLRASLAVAAASDGAADVHLPGIWERALADEDVPVARARMQELLG